MRLEPWLGLPDGRDDESLEVLPLLSSGAWKVDIPGSHVEEEAARLKNQTAQRERVVGW